VRRDVSSSRDVSGRQPSRRPSVELNADPTAQAHPPYTAGKTVLVVFADVLCNSSVDRRLVEANYAQKRLEEHFSTCRASVAVASSTRTRGIWMIRPSLADARLRSNGAYLPISCNTARLNRLPGLLQQSASACLFPP
jgi:hypothetical protein